MLKIINHPHHYSFFFFNDTATTEIYTLSLHDALPIWSTWNDGCTERTSWLPAKGRSITLHLWEKESGRLRGAVVPSRLPRSEEHTSELQSRQYLVCRLLLEKKKSNLWTIYTPPHLMVY